MNMKLKQFLSAKRDLYPIFIVAQVFINELVKILYTFILYTHTHLYINEYHSTLKESYGNTDVKQNKPGVERQMIIDSYEYYKNISLVRNTERRGWQDGSMSDGLN